MTARRWTRLRAARYAGAGALFVAWLAIEVGGRAATGTFANLATTAAAVVAAVVAVRRPEVGWRLVGLGVGAWGAGQAIWSWYELVARRDVPFPSLADVGYVAMVPFAVAGVVCVARNAGGGSVGRGRLVLDVLVTGTAVGGLAWVAVLGTAAAGSSGLERVLALAYPAGDALLLAIVFAVFVRGGAAQRRSLAWLAAGLVSFAVGDIAFAYLTARGTYHSGELTDAGWFLGFLLVAYAAGRGEEDANEPIPAFHLWAYLPAVVVVAAAAAERVVREPADHRLDGVILVMLALVVVRNALASVENGRLQRDLAEEMATVRQAERRWAAMVENASDIMAVLDGSGRLRYATPAGARLVGAAPDDAEVTLGMYVHPDDLASVTASFAEVTAAPGRSARIEFRVRAGDGTWRWIESVATNQLNDDAVRGVVYNLRDVTDRKLAEDSLRHQARHDPLTELGNRAALGEFLDSVLADRRRRTPAALLLVDLDGFKDINDTFGHHAGDDLLREVADRLRRATRGGDLVARLGGDEFAVVVPDLRETTDALAVVEHVLAGLSEPVALAGGVVDVAASIGIALAPEHAADTEGLLRCADRAMYRAKRSGLNGWALYGPDDEGGDVSRLEFLSDLRLAPQSGQLRVAYQPKVDLVTGLAVGVEALCRWDHPTRGAIPPDQFIPAAEHTRVIAPLTDYVLRTALADVARWRAEGIDLGVSVNLSARLLGSADLVAAVAEALAEARLPASALTLEITETAAAECSSPQIESLRWLRALGVQIAVDDFGTGYSSLAHLRRLPVDELKIDKSFVTSLDHDDRDLALVSGVVDLSRRLRVGTVAEGVETTATAEALRRAGCDLAQGYLWAAPMPAAEVPAWLATRTRR